MSDPLDLRFARASMFEPLVGAEFVSREPAVRFVLIDVEAYGIQPGAPRAEPFTLTFVGDPGLVQRIYELDHVTLGRLDLFLVPIGPGPDRRSRYEAVFN